MLEAVNCQQKRLGPFAWPSPHVLWAAKQVPVPASDWIQLLCIWFVFGQPCVQQSCKIQCFMYCAVGLGAWRMCVVSAWSGGGMFVSL